jgi:hypothetical protein
MADSLLTITYHITPYNTNYSGQDHCILKFAKVLQSHNDDYLQSTFSAGTCVEGKQQHLLIQQYKHPCNYVAQCYNTKLVIKLTNHDMHTCIAKVNNKTYTS